MLSFKYRIYPSREQVQQLHKQMKLAKEIYNILLDKSKAHYRETGKTFTQFDMNKHITVLKKDHPEFNELHCHVLQNISKRLSDAYKAFFRRAKAKKAGSKIKVGFPRPKKFVSSLTYPDSGFKFISESRFHLFGVGNIPMVYHRIPKGEIKTCWVKQYPSGKWYIGLCNEIEEEEFESNGRKAIGADVGLKSFVAMSNGEKIKTPKFLRESEDKLKILSRRVSRKKLGSRNRRKARIKKARLEEKIVNQRFDFLHKLSFKQVNQYGKIAVEKLKVQNMVRNHCLAKSISDAGWSTYKNMLHYKAQSAGCEIIEVAPENTTKECSQCGKIKEMPLKIRTYNCPHCGYKEDRDVNAAKNILKRATSGLEGSHACGDMSNTSRSKILAQDISKKQELYGART